MVDIQLVHSLFDRLSPASTRMSETTENVAASLRIQLETSKKIVEMTCQMATMTDLAREANRECESLRDILLTISSLTVTAIQVDELAVGIQRLEVASQSMQNSRSMLQPLTHTKS